MSYKNGYKFSFQSINEKVKQKQIKNHQKDLIDQQNYNRKIEKYIDKDIQMHNNSTQNNNNHHKKNRKHQSTSSNNQYNTPKFLSIDFTQQSHQLNKNNKTNNVFKNNNLSIKIQSQLPNFQKNQHFQTQSIKRSSSNYKPKSYLSNFFTPTYKNSKSPKININIHINNSTSKNKNNSLINLKSQNSIQQTVHLNHDAFQRFFKLKNSPKQKESTKLFKGCQISPNHFNRQLIQKGVKSFDRPRRPLSLKSLTSQIKQNKSSLINAVKLPSPKAKEKQTKFFQKIKEQQINIVPLEKITESHTPINFKNRKNKDRRLQILKKQLPKNNKYIEVQMQQLNKKLFNLSIQTQQNIQI